MKVKWTFDIHLINAIVMIHTNLIMKAEYDGGGVDVQDEWHDEH